MSLWRQITRGVRILTHRSAADADVDDEARHYFEETISALIARGLSPDEARRAARLELGTMATVSEDVRAYGWENVLGATIADLRYGVRRLRTTPGFTAITVLTLAISPEAIDDADACVTLRSDTIGRICRSLRYHGWRHRNLTSHRARSTC
jgi:putative ABC transport system permease protein